jgi:hypothetical protein
VDEQRQQPALLAARNGGNHSAVPRAVQQLRRGKEDGQAASDRWECRESGHNTPVPDSKQADYAASSPQ